MSIGPDRRGFVVLLGALMVINSLSIDMMLPALPALGQDLAATPDQVQLVLSLYLIGYAASQFVCGPLSDRFGRRRVLMAGLALFFAASIACALSRRIELLVAARVVQGIAACGGPVVVRAIVRDHLGGDRAAAMLSSLTAVFAAGPLFAPIIGGALLVWFGWPSIFVLLAAWAAALMLVVWRSLAESLKEPDRDALRPHRLLANYRTFLTTRATIAHALVNGFCSAGIFAFISGSPYVFIDLYGVRPDHFGYYFGMSAVTLVLGAATNRRLLRRMPGARVLRYGFAVLVGGGALVLLVPLTPWAGPATVMGAVMIYMFGQTLVQPNAVAAALEPLKHMAGMGSALMGVIQMVCAALCGYAVNALYDGTARPMAGAILIASLASTGLYFALVRPQPQPA